MASRALTLTTPLLQQEICHSTSEGQKRVDLSCKFFIFLSNLLLFYAHWYFVCMCVCVRVVSNALEQEPQTAASRHVDAGD